jgi:hypothetical protein
MEFNYISLRDSPEKGTVMDKERPGPIIELITIAIGVIIGSIIADLIIGCFS